MQLLIIKRTRFAFVRS